MSSLLGGLRSATFTVPEQDPPDCPYLVLRTRNEALEGQYRLSAGWASVHPVVRLPCVLPISSVGESKAPCLRINYSHHSGLGERDRRGAE